MLVKIQNIQGQMVAQNITNKQGKAMKLFFWNIVAFINGQQVFTQIKTMSEKIVPLVKVGAEFECKENNYQGQISYFIDSEKAKENAGIAGGNKWGPATKPAGKLTADEYLEFCDKCFKKAIDISGNSDTPLIFERILNNANFFINQDSLKFGNINAQNIDRVYNDDSIPFDPYSDGKMDF